MKSYKLILCPTDLTPESDAALGYAAALAVANDARLLVVHWCEDAPYDPTEGVAIRPGPPGLFEESIALNVDPSLVGSLRWEGLVVNGSSAGEAIADAAVERGAHLVVMRSRRRPLGAALLGSTAETVSRIAPCSVLVTHPARRGSAGDRPDRLRLERILVAYDFWDDSEIAFQHALRIAAQYGAEVHLLHAIQHPSGGGPEVAWAPPGPEGQLYRIEGRLRVAAPHAASLGVRVVPHVVIGRPYREILAFAEANAIDLICMGARGRDFGAMSLFGSNSDRVLRQAPCPVLVARPLASLSGPAFGARTATTEHEPPARGSRTLTRHRLDSVAGAGEDRRAEAGGEWRHA
jgi:nucleotide-binding universal stress UspA family protein